MKKLSYGETRRKYGHRNYVRRRDSPRNEKDQLQKNIHA